MKAPPRPPPHEAKSCIIDYDSVGPQEFALDTATSFNVVGQDLDGQKVDALDIGPVGTAGRIVNPTKVMSTHLDTLRENIQAIHMHGSPNSLSVGQRCARMGYEFHWRLYNREPEFCYPDGTPVYLIVRRLVPSNSSATPAQKDDAQRELRVMVVGSSVAECRLGDEHVSASDDAGPIALRDDVPEVPQIAEEDLGDARKLVR